MPCAACCAGAQPPVVCSLPTHLGAALLRTLCCCVLSFPLPAADPVQTSSRAGSPTSCATRPSRCAAASGGACACWVAMSQLLMALYLLGLACTCGESIHALPNASGLVLIFLPLSLFPPFSPCSTSAPQLSCWCTTAPQPTPWCSPAERCPHATTTPAQCPPTAAARRMDSAPMVRRECPSATGPMAACSGRGPQASLCGRRTEWRLAAPDAPPASLLGG